VPVCYAWGGTAAYIALDAKPKRVAPGLLRRVRNILENPRVALLVDHYSDDWSELRYLLLRGPASLLPPGDDEQQLAIQLLRDRYGQYQHMPIEQHAVIVLRPESVVAWAFAEGGEPGALPAA